MMKNRVNFDVVEVGVFVVESDKNRLIAVFAPRFLN